MIDRTADLPETYDETVDLVVVGSGSAGMTGALVAALEGASVAVLEKADLIGGTSSISGGGAWVPLNDHMGEEGVEDSREDALAYVRACAGDAGDDALLVALVDGGAEMARFLERRGGLSFRPWPAQGGTLDYRPWLHGARHGARTLDAGRFELSDLGEWASRLRFGFESEWLMDKFDYYRGRQHSLPLTADLPNRLRDHGADLGSIRSVAAGSALMGQLLRACLREQVAVHTGAPASELLVEDGRVCGVRALRDGRPWCVRARGGVLLATGGFGHNAELKRLWLTRPLEYTCEIEECQGDGHLMGLAVGAQVAGLGDAWWMPQLVVAELADGTKGTVSSREDRCLPHTLIVNRAGRRFVNESLNYYDVCEAFGAKQGGSARNFPAFLLFDRQAVEKYSIFARRAPAEGAPAPPWLTVADSLEGLAGALGVDAGGLAGTVARFNGFAHSGVDLDFGRGESDWDREWGDHAHGPNRALGTLAQPPFYALEIRPGALGTKGGLRVDAQARVLSAAPPFGPIPGLYAAGNCANGGHPVGYPGAGATIGAAMTFGYLAARDVVRTTVPA